MSSSGTLYVPTDSGLHRLHPLSKGAFVIFFLVCAATLPNLVWLLAAFLLLQLPLALWGKISRPFLKNCIAVMAPFVISLTIIQGLFTGGATVLFTLGPLTFTLEGMLAGLTVAGRILLAIGGALLLMYSTRPDALMLALTQRGLPHSLAYIVLSALQILPRFQERATVILDAQRARGLETDVNLFGRMKLLVPLVGPLVLGSIVDVEERAMALEARAFSRSGRKTSLLVLADSPGQRLLRAGLLFLSVALIAVRIWGALR
jgi:energy-coupling factor transport system permease protein